MNKKSFLIFLLLPYAFFSNAAEPSLEQKQALFMINYAQYSAYKLKTYNNIAALEDEYKNLKDNMNLELIKDESSVQTINYLMDAIHEERKNNKNRERLETSIKRRMNNAIYDSFSQLPSVFIGSVAGGSPLNIVINTVQNTGMMYMNYKRYKNQLSEEYDEKMWEYQQLSEDELNFIYKELNTYSHQLIQQYGISDEWRVNENELSKMFTFLKDEDENRRFVNLQNLSGDRFYQHFPLFWYHIAQSALNSNHEKEALNYFARFEKENVQIFRYDTIAVDAYKGKISLLLKNQKANLSEIRSKLKFIESNKTTWSDYYYCALVYAALGDTANAKRILERNINELAALVDTDLMDKTSIAKIYASDYDLDGGKKIQKGTLGYEYYQSAASKKLSKNPYNTNYDGLELSRNLLQKLGSEGIALSSVEKQYRQDTSSFNEALYFFGGTSTSNVAANSVEDIMKIKLSTVATSEKTMTVTCQLPIQWMLSSSTKLYAVFKDSSDNTVQYELFIDESSMKKLKKEKLSECELIYTSGKLSNDWKKNGFSFVKLILSHPIYPVELIYNLDLAKNNQNCIPDAFVFKDKNYEIENQQEEKSSVVDSVVNSVKKVFKK